MTFELYPKVVGAKRNCMCRGSISVSLNAFCQTDRNEIDENNSAKKNRKILE
jgi:hypothetical protein